MYDEIRIVYKKGSMQDTITKIDRKYLQSSEFKEKVKKYLTKAEYKRYQKAFVTKTEFQQEMFSNTTSLMVEIAKLGTELRSEIRESFATIMQEIKLMRQEMVGILENHQDRITSIEKKLPRTKKLTT